MPCAYVSGSHKRNWSKQPMYTQQINCFTSFTHPSLLIFLFFSYIHTNTQLVQSLSVAVEDQSRFFWEVCVCVNACVCMCTSFWNRYKYVIAQPAQFTQSSSSATMGFCGFGIEGPKNTRQCKSSCGIQTTPLAVPYQKEPPTSLIHHHNHSVPHLEFYIFWIPHIFLKASHFGMHRWAWLPHQHHVKHWRIRKTQLSIRKGLQQEFPLRSELWDNSHTDRHCSSTCSPSQPDLVWYGEWTHTPNEIQNDKDPSFDVYEVEAVPSKVCCKWGVWTCLRNESHTRLKLLHNTQ